MGRRRIELQLSDQARKARRLTLGQLEHLPGEGRRIDDRVRQRCLETAAHEPGVESVVAVLDQHGTLRESEKCAPDILEFGCADEHGTVDLMALSRIRIDGGAAVDQGVEEGERTAEIEALGAQLQDQEGRVARGFDVQGHELGLVERGRRADVRSIDCDLLPRHRLRGAARFEKDRLQLRLRSAKRTNSISSGVTDRSTNAATT